MITLAKLVIFPLWILSTRAISDTFLVPNFNPLLGARGPFPAHYISSGNNRFEVINEKVLPGLEVPVPGGALNFVYPSWLFEKMKEQLEPFELEDFLEGRFIAKGWNGTWISDESFIFAGADSNVYKLSLKEKQYSRFFSSEVLKKFNGPSISVTKDERYILIRHDSEPVFRHSTKAQFTIYDVQNDKYYDVAEKKLLQIAQWAPEGHGLVYVFENNIFYVSNPENSQGVQITFDGVPGVIYNGVSDWVYEEEILLSGSAIWFSPDGKKLAFAQFDDTKVQEYHYVLYGNPGDINDLYPKVVTIRYPKSGTTNPTVKVKCIDFETGKVTELDKIIPEEHVTSDNVLYRVVWATNTEIAALSLNRTQNVGVLKRCNVDTNLCEVESLFDEARGWLELDAPIYSKDGSSYLMEVSQFDGGDTYKHLVLYYSGKNAFTRLTRGKRVVSTVYGWDQERDLIYYGSTLEDQPSQEHIFVVNVQTGEDKCLSCDFETPEGVCKYSTPAFSKKFSYITKGCQGSGPNYIIVQNTQDLSDGFLWEGNEELRAKLKKKTHPIIEDLKIELNNSFTARARLMFPPGVDMSGKTKYPMIVDVYAGPNFNRILDAFSIGYEHYLVTKRKYIVAFIDGRGSGRMGDRNLFAIYRDLGNKEILDQIEVTKFLQDNFPCIDAGRTAIWGWSYGGFASLHALVKDTENVFKMGLAVAPVVNFLYYDTIYTERYMGLPTKDDNQIGYNRTDLTKAESIEKLRNKLFFLIHGNGDDNVHYQQSMLLSKALEHADVLFYQQSYPDETHSLSNVYPHLYHTMDKYFAYGLRPKGKCKIEKAWDCTDRF